MDAKRRQLFENRMRRGVSAGDQRAEQAVGFHPVASAGFGAVQRLVGAPHQVARALSGPPGRQAARPKHPVTGGSPTGNVCGVSRRLLKRSVSEVA